MPPHHKYAYIVSHIYTTDERPDRGPRPTARNYTFTRDETCRRGAGRPQGQSSDGQWPEDAPRAERREPPHHAENKCTPCAAAARGGRNTARRTTRQEYQSRCTHTAGSFRHLRRHLTTHHQNFSHEGLSDRPDAKEAVCIFMSVLHDHCLRK